MILLAGRRKWQRASWLERHSLSLVLLALLVAQALAYLALEWPDWRAEQRAHGQPGAFDGFVSHFWAEMLVAIVAGAYGALPLVLATKWFYEQGSRESKDPDEDGA